MKVTVSAKVNAKFEKVEKTETGYAVWTKAAPIEGKANTAIIKLLAAHLGVPRSNVCLTSGARGRRKVFEIK